MIGRELHGGCFEGCGLEIPIDPGVIAGKVDTSGGPLTGIPADQAEELIRILGLQR